MSRAEGFAPVERVLADPIGALGSDSVGFVGPDIPIEVLLAGGRPFGHLAWDVAGNTPWADRWLESSFPFWARSILEQWHAGVFDPLESVVFTRGDDASQRLFYYVAELQRRGLLQGPRPVIFDITHSRSESSAEYTAAAIAKLMQSLEVDAAALPAGIEAGNRLRVTLAQIQDARMSRGPSYEQLARAVLWSNCAAWIDAISLPQAAAARSRVLLAGSMPPDDRIHQAVEDAGASIIAEAHALDLGRLGPVFTCPSQRPELAIARHTQEASLGPRAVFDRARWLVDQANAVHADAVIIWLTREDEALAWHVPSQRRALEAAGFPQLVMPAANWNAGSADLDTVAQFISNEVIR